MSEAVRDNPVSSSSLEEISVEGTTEKFDKEMMDLIRLNASFKLMEKSIRRIRSMINSRMYDSDVKKGILTGRMMICEEIMKSVERLARNYSGEEYVDNYIGSLRRDMSSLREDTRPYIVQVPNSF